MRGLREEVFGTPRALRALLDEERPRYEALIRQTRWGDGPIFIVGSGGERIAGLAGAYAFEGLLGWPVVVREAAEFIHYSLGGLRPRSVLLAVSRAGQSQETLEAAQAARRRGASVLALTGDTRSPLAQLAEGVFRVPVAAQTSPGRSMVREHAVLSYLALLAALALKRQHPQLTSLREDFEKLPEQVEWMLTQLADAVRAFADELKGWEYLPVVAAGPYQPVALQWARLLKKRTGFLSEALEPEEGSAQLLEKLRRETAVVFLGGSRCQMKKAIHYLASVAKGAGLRIVSVTDRNDRDLVERSAMAMLLPTTSELAGSVLTLALLEWVSCCAFASR